MTARCTQHNQGEHAYPKLPSLQLAQGIWLCIDDAGDVLRLLRLMRVGGPLEHLEVIEQRATQTPFGQHPFHSPLHNSLRNPLELDQALSPHTTEEYFY